MTRIQDTLFCDGCGVEIPLSPVLKNGREYCCQECSQGVPCQCGQRMELEDYHDSTRSSYAHLPVYQDNWSG